VTLLFKPAELYFFGSWARFLAAFWKLSVLAYSGFNWGPGFISQHPKEVW
jgi:hypothetical protein